MFKLFLFTVLAVLQPFRVADPNTGFVWGINGHPLTQADYKNNWDEQINALKDLKVSSYRFDVQLDATGDAKNPDKFASLLKILTANHISPLPAVMLSGFKDLNQQDIYIKAYDQGKLFANKYGDQLTVIEVGNEGDDKTIKKGNYDGTLPGHYDTAKATRLILSTKGFIDGLKRVKSSVKVTLSFSWTHFYYLQMLKDNQVNYDIIGYHWYSNMGDITNVRRPFGNVLRLVSQRFNKPIWITEFNYFKGTSRIDFARQNQFISDNLKKIIAQGIISGFYIYELLDQPALKQRYPGEANYGILYQDSSGRYVEKQAYAGYKQLIANYNRSSF